jgi:hypothetical protein
MNNKKHTFKTINELTEFVNGESCCLYLKVNPTKVLDVDYFKLTVTISAKENRKFENESDLYYYREIGLRDALTDIKMAEKRQHPSDTKWMQKIPIITTKKGE